MKPMAVMRKKKVVVLGAGPCGLYAARVLTRNGHSVTVIDKNERPGGLATSFRYGQNWYDFGVHMFHSFDEEIFADIKTVMGEERIEVGLNAQIKWAGSAYRYPLQFQDMIKGIPIFKLCKQVFSLFGAQIRNYFFPWEAKNAEEALIQLYGKPLYEFFFKEFTHRYWELHPRALSATFITTKMPKLTAVDVLKKGFEKIGIKQRARSTESALAKETLHYSRNGAEAMPRCLAKAITQAGGQIIQQAPVEQLSVINKKVRSVCYRQNGKMKEIECDECISTIPLNTLIAAVQPLSPAPVREAVEYLRYKPIVIFGLLVNKPKCLDALYVYYRDRIFHRVGEPKNAGLIVEPADHTVLIVEMTCEYNDARWRGEKKIRQQMIDDLQAESICQSQEIVEMHLTTNEHGYPIFTLGFEPHLDTVKNYISQIANLQSVGRQGAFTYPNMHKAMRMGWDAANNVMKNKG